MVWVLVNLGGLEGLLGMGLVGVLSGGEAVIVDVDAKHLALAISVDHQLDSGHRLRLLDLRLLLLQRRWIHQIVGLIALRSDVALA